MCAHRLLYTFGNVLEETGNGKLKNLGPLVIPPVCALTVVVGHKLLSEVAFETFVVLHTDFDLNQAVFFSLHHLEKQVWLAGHITKALVSKVLDLVEWMRFKLDRKCLRIRGLTKSSSAYI
ncbi:hypothetical protein HYQ46_008218 [Verticillium longisporum]|nr:hypothetical protein HYQ46_008218 [Verticillium longisporum]